MNIKSRNNIADILNINSIGCELGVFEGEFASILAKSNKFSKLYLVDTFYGEASNFGKFYADASILENIVKNKFINCNNISIIKNDSINFLKNCQDNYFDFIYIDTGHSYDQTILELNESYKKIKSNGFLCGHDYCYRSFPGVVKAVDEFASIYSIKINLTKESYLPSFILNIQK